jgi:hypothetical protein
MCNPLAILAGAQIGGALIGARAESQQANALAGMIGQNFALQNEALDAQRGEITARASDEISERARQAVLERGRLRAIAAESGLTGISQERALRESFFNEGLDIASIESNRDRSLEQTERTRKSSQIEAQRQVAGLKRPSLLGVGLQIASAAGNYANRSSTRTPTRG